MRHAAVFVLSVPYLVGCPAKGASATEDSQTSAATSESSGDPSDSSGPTTSTDSESSDTGTLDMGDGEDVHHPPGQSMPCEITPGDHASVCPDDQPCPIVDDVLIRCENTNIRDDADGVSVDAEHVYTIAQSNEGGWLFTIHGDSGEVVALPDVIDDAAMRMTGDQSGSPHMLATTTWSGRQHFYMLPEGDGFLVEPIAPATPDDNYTRPYVIELDSLERPQVWVRQEYGVDHGIRDPTWMLGPSGSVSFSRHTLGLDRLDRQVELIHLGGGPEVQLAARIAGVDRPLGEPFMGDWVNAVLGQPIRPSQDDPGLIDYAVSYQPWFLHVVWPVGPAGPDAWQEIQIAEAVPNLNPCPTQCPCPETCTDDVGGVARKQLAQTSDDELWLAWTFDVDNTLYSQYETMNNGECTCLAMPWFDEPVSSFHLVRIDLGDASYTEVLSLQLPGQILEIDIAALARRLGVRLYINEEGPRSLRVLGLDLDAF